MKATRFFSIFTTAIVIGIILGKFFPQLMTLPNFLIYSGIGALFVFWIIDFFIVRAKVLIPRPLKLFSIVPAFLMVAGFSAGITGCAALGLTAPQSFDEQLAEAYGVHTAVVSATATALTAGALSRAEAQAAQTQEVGARAMLDAAKAAESTNTTGAQNDLTLASAALSAIEAYLKSVGVTPPAPTAAPAAPGT
jgi:hypothetical protein